jgi:hypothetical protein
MLCNLNVFCGDKFSLKNLVKKYSSKEDDYVSGVLKVYGLMESDFKSIVYIYGEERNTYSFHCSSYNFHCDNSDFNLSVLYDNEPRLPRLGLEWMGSFSLNFPQHKTKSILVEKH